MTVKTAVSLRRELFVKSEALAGEMRISRSRLVALALDQFIRRRQNRELLARINAACDEPTPPERALRRGMRRLQRRIVEGQY